MYYQYLHNIFIYYLKIAFLFLDDDMRFAKETNLHPEHSRPKMYGNVFLFYTKTLSRFWIYTQ